MCSNMTMITTTYLDSLTDNRLCRPKWLIESSQTGFLLHSLLLVIRLTYEFHNYIKLILITSENSQAPHSGLDVTVLDHFNFACLSMLTCRLNHKKNKKSQ